MGDLEVGCDDSFQGQHSQSQAHHAHHSTVDHHNHVHLYHDPSNHNANSNLVYYQPYYFTTLNYHQGDIPPPPSVGIVSDDPNNNLTHGHHSQHHHHHHHSGSTQVTVEQQHHPIHHNIHAQIQPLSDGNCLREGGDSSTPESLPNSASNGSLEDSPPCYEMALLCPKALPPGEDIGVKIAPPSDSIYSSPAKDSLIKGESIEYKNGSELNESINRLQHLHQQHQYHHSSTPSTSRNPSQEDEVETSGATQPEVDNDKCEEE